MTRAELRGMEKRLVERQGEFAKTPDPARRAVLRAEYRREWESWKAAKEQLVLDV